MNEKLVGTVENQVTTATDESLYADSAWRQLNPELAALTARDMVSEGQVSSDPFLIHLKTDASDPNTIPTEPSQEEPPTTPTSTARPLSRREQYEEAVKAAKQAGSTDPLKPIIDSRPKANQAKDASGSSTAIEPAPNEQPKPLEDKRPRRQQRRPAQQAPSQPPAKPEKIIPPAAKTPDKPQFSKQQVSPQRPPGQPQQTMLPQMGMGGMPSMMMPNSMRPPDTSRLDKLKAKYPRVAPLVDTAQMLALLPLDTSHNILDTYRSQRAARKLSGSTEAQLIEDQRLRQVYQDAIRNMGLMTKLLSDPEFADGVNQYAIDQYKHPLDELPIHLRIEALTKAAGRLGAMDDIVPMIEENEQSLARDQIAMANLNSIMHDLARLGEISPHAISFAAKGMEALQVQMAIYPRYQEQMRQYQIIHHSTNLQNTWLVEAGKMANRLGVPPAIFLQFISVTTQTWGDFAAAQPVTATGLVAGGLYGYATVASTIAAEQGLFAAGIQGILLPAIVGAFGVHTARGLAVAAKRWWSYRDIVTKADTETQGKHYTGYRGLKPPEDPHDTP